MDTYRLLRNNAETGPFSLEQLLQSGLKPYDLLWVEGKSAGWRYSSEIDSLKEYSPVVEEQPFDRFYRKPKEEKHFHELVKKEEKSEVFKNQKQLTLISEKPSKVYISLPGNEKIHVEKKEIPTIIKPAFTEQIKKEKNLETPSYKLIKDDNNSYEINKSDQQKVVKPASLEKGILKKPNLKSLFIYGSAAVYLISLGVLIYFVARPEKTFKQNISSTVPSNATSREILNASLDLPELVQEPSILESEKEFEKSDAENPLVSSSISKTKELTILQKKTQDKREAVTNNTNKETEPQVYTKTNEENAVRIKSVREQDINQANSTEKNINDLVSVSANEYKRRPFGGIFNLQLTVKNSSSYILNKVAVQLHYLKPSEQTLIADTIIFSSIAPNGSMTIKVPDQVRGIKVIYKIINIESSQYDKSTAGL